MVTEKLAKAYFWRTGVSPSKSHAGFVKFLRALGALNQSKRQKQVVEALGFKNYVGFQAFVQGAVPLAHKLERLAPALALDGPNPEYPWPQADPEFASADFSFDIWPELQAGRGRQFIKVVQNAVNNFSRYG